MEKQANTGSIVISAVFGTENSLVPERCSEARPFRRLSTSSFGVNNFGNTCARRLIFFQNVGNFMTFPEMQ